MKKKDPWKTTYLASLSKAERDRVQQHCSRRVAEGNYDSLIMTDYND